jgi:hypothetical protein
MSDGRFETLAALLEDLFDAAGLRRWVHGALGQRVYDELPGTDVSLAELAFQTELLVRKRGSLEKAMRALLDARPERAADIDATAQILRRAVRASRRRRRLMAVVAGVLVLGAASLFVAPVREAILGEESGELGIWRVEARLENPRPARGEPLRLHVRSPVDGYLWVFSPEDNRPNVVFPCGPDLTPCRTEVAEGRHRILASARRPVPLEGTDPFGIRARSTPGRETLVIVVTAANELSTALGHLLAMRPELDIRAEALRAGNWGAAVISYDVE